MKTVHSSQFTVHRLFLILLLLSTINCHLLTNGAEAAPVSFQELLEEPEKYDGETITFKGEGIGDIMLRKDGAWLNVRDKTGTIGIFCPQDEVAQIKYTGSYKFSGDIVSVRGVFHHCCPQHGGDTDIHAEKITVIEEGKEILHPLQPQKVRLSIILPAIALALAIIHLVTRRLR